MRKTIIFLTVAMSMLCLSCNTLYPYRSEYSLTHKFDVNSNGLLETEELHALIYYIRGDRSFKSVEQNILLFDYNSDNKISRFELGNYFNH